MICVICARCSALAPTFSSMRWFIAGAPKPSPRMLRSPGPAQAADADTVPAAARVASASRRRIERDRVVFIRLCMAVFLGVEADVCILCPRLVGAMRAS